ncbi:hypothetical protein HYPSUDRAFT_913644 [Hypholoma sublateritium FD-334 SS-4]|uniref:Uncharacterized protein n=1 Tax=Hypholoma sublateritium (strain FD-334 SS-4) TaxID=945553 RepID=A0A0D2PF42_HYPSF|nr:hypothetical protein HYPSUDRAFT_913644 [Hypholoma sublateritium FD-334 SS-4]
MSAPKAKGNSCAVLQFASHRVACVSPQAPTTGHAVAPRRAASFRIQRTIMNSNLNTRDVQSSSVILKIYWYHRILSKVVRACI